MRADWQLWAQTLHLPGLQDSAQCGGLCPGLQVTEDNLNISLLIWTWCPGWPSGVRVSASDQESPHLRILETVSCLTSSQRVFVMLVMWSKYVFKSLITTFQNDLYLFSRIPPGTFTPSVSIWTALMGTTRALWAPWDPQVIQDINPDAQYPHYTAPWLWHWGLIGALSRYCAEMSQVVNS